MATAQPSEAAAEADLLRWATAGSVDDGKSTLVGRLLHDSKSVLADQLEAVARASSGEGPDLALLTDGLRAEREQGITIDVAYRYFATPRRRFILADTPGHVQYTRNMVTGASTATLTVILVDARKGVVEQTRRHAAVAALLRVPHVVLAVNKMDLVDYEQSVFADIAAEFTRHAAGLGIAEVTAIPISALAGDNVVERSTRMDWYAGPTVLAHLESVPVDDEANDGPARFPVQYVIRSGDVRLYAGQVAAGALRVGDRVTVLPSGRTTTVTGIDVLGAPAETVRAPQSGGLRLADDLDVSRGDLIVPAAAPPALSRDVEATVCHLHERPLRPGDHVLLKHTTRTVRAVVRRIPGPGRLDLNEIGRIALRTAEQLAFDRYEDSRRTGSFVLIDPADGSTLTAGMVGATVPGPPDAPA
ncbi:sulfate adenylyltransferase [Streptomyces lincolnensis]|uniref:sulfate adenylyltransferase subunit 1 n=1 Tax=Streptomyces lincolnensis TaxID=1915 RepID=UPI001E5EED41|nr:GTP-binding protein [Streptomyces lincolnensis]MCD7438708.1 sulfate adenylyltransferase [Streptomyces lincolnensis]